MLSKTVSVVEPQLQRVTYSAFGIRTKPFISLIILQIILVALVVLGSVLVNSNQYGPTYNDAHEQAEYQPQMSYQQESSYGGSSGYQQAPSYSPPAYKQQSYAKYNAPSSAHHTQYDNYYPKQTYSQPTYQAPRPYSPPPMYKQQSYMQSKPMYQAPSYGGNQYESADYRARA